MFSMFVIIARYKMARKHHKKFRKESERFYLNRLGRAKGFLGLMFLRNVLDPEYVDVVTQWNNSNAFERFIQKHPHQPKFTIPHEVLDRFLYETID